LRKKQARQTRVNIVTETKLNGSAKARQLNRRRISRRGQDDKLRLKISVDDAVTVTVADGFQELPHVVT